ncbi:uncharacterized protein LOC143048830 [Mytilus galloprovincialis]|uniref:uncharacterized protein LOC143048830 n=1 Tax=Mytilus galloprovincialis TaxID=29158 RepID=UPI003F7CC159
MEIKASKIFLGVTKLTSNTAVQGNLGWLSCHAKQRLEVLRFFYKLENRRSWNFNVIKLFRNMSVEHLMQPGISKELFFKVIKSKLRILDEQLWFTKLWNDNSNVNGNKLRLYRRYKKDLQPEHYVTNAIPRHLRSNLCKFRCGTLPLSVETGRYTKPPIPLEERICPFCNNAVEDEIHFLINCDIYSDSRFNLFHRAKLSPLDH